MLESHITLYRNKQDIVSQKRGRVIDFNLQMDTLYYLYYSSYDYGSDSDIIYLDSKVFKCLMTDAKVCNNINGDYKTDCEYKTFENETKPAFFCDFYYGNYGPYSYYSTDKGIVARVSFLAKHAETLVFLVKFKNSKNTLLHEFAKVRWKDGDKFKSNIMKYNVSLAEYSADYLYTVSFYNDGEPYKHKSFIIDKRITSCNENSCKYQIDYKGTMLNTTCKKNTYRYYECGVNGETDQYLNYRLDKDTGYIEILTD